MVAAIFSAREEEEEVEEEAGPDENREIENIGGIKGNIKKVGHTKINIEFMTERKKGGEVLQPMGKERCI